MFHIMLTEITSFDFDYIGAAVLILEQHLLTLLSQMQCFNLRADCTIRGGHIWNKYGLVLISMLIIILTCTFFVGEKGSHYMAERPDF